MAVGSRVAMMTGPAKDDSTTPICFFVLFRYCLIALSLIPACLACYAWRGGRLKMSLLKGAIYFKKLQ
jgi:hypothetical protein